MALLCTIAVVALTAIPRAFADDLHSCSLVCPPPQVCAPQHGQNSYICTVGSQPFPEERHQSVDLPIS